MNVQQEQKLREEISFLKAITEIKERSDRYEKALKEIAMANNPSRLAGCPSIAKEALGEALYQ